jgi:general secretion pathway protein L
MARILGLDLGSYSVKAVVLETNLRGFTTQAFAEVRCGEGERLDRIKAVLPELFSKGPFTADTVVVALPGPSLATHQLSMPFSDPKKIEATLAFEVEGQLPFDLSEAVWDYQLASSDEKGSQLMVGVVKRDELSSLLASLKDAKVDPRVVTHPGLVYQNLLAALPASHLPENPQGAVAIVDIGHERICVAIGRPGQGIEHARTFTGGGAALTRALAVEFKITPAEAAKWKEEHGAVGEAAVGEDAERAAGAFIRGLQPLLRELRPTLKAYTAKTRRTVEKVFICGGTAQLAGLDLQLEKDLGVPVRRLPLPADSNTAIDPAHAATAAQAFALALRGQATGAKAPRFNLRRGELAFKSDFDFMREKVGQLVTFGLILFVLLIAGGMVRNTVLERREKQVDQVLCDVTQRVLGTCEKNFDKALNMLRGKESPAAGVPRRSAVNLLAELTGRIPTDVPVTMEQIVVDVEGSRIGVRCEATSSKQMEDLISALKTFKCFKEVKEGKVEKSKDGLKVNFRLDVQVECPDEGQS